MKTKYIMAIVAGMAMGTVMAQAKGGNGNGNGAGDCTQSKKQTCAQECKQDCAQCQSQDCAGCAGQEKKQMRKKDGSGAKAGTGTCTQ